MYISKDSDTIRGVLSLSSLSHHDSNWSWAFLTNIVTNLQRKKAYLALEVLLSKLTYPKQIQPPIKGRMSLQCMENAVLHGRRLPSCSLTGSSVHDLLKNHVIWWKSFWRQECCFSPCWKLHGNGEFRLADGEGSDKKFGTGEGIGQQGVGQEEMSCELQ